MKKISLLLILITISPMILAQWTTSGSDIYYSSGNVGIGISNPLEDLHINDADFTNLQLSTPHGGKGENIVLKFLTDVSSANQSYSRHAIWFGDSDNNSAGAIKYQHKWTSQDEDFMSFHTAGMEQLRISNDGNVGIGTTSPDQKLHIAGSGYIRALVQSSDNHAYYVVEGGANRGAFVDYYRSGDGRIWHTGLRHNSNNFEFRLDDQSTILSLTETENVGIGTSTPDQKLTVKGKIHSEEIIVDLNVPGPDYVFEPEYELTTLAELEAFIQANKHLPEIPSAATMEEEGIILGEMNMLLLKKIEELTLHIIEQDKTKRSQEKQLITQDERLSHQQVLIIELLERIENLEKQTNNQ